MLKLRHITKDYVMSDEIVHAIKDLSVNFRRSEFVAILGPSGCGKTTLLNIVGGLDRYTSGDLVIEGKSTKQYKDRDWDTYRNRSIGFVFQSYNLINHISVLSNVELALTLSGVGRAERRKRAIEALKTVGLADRIKKRPNQLSGGQMQRVAIARALVNNPEILLADEPTGALDSETSVQIMDLLKEVSKNRLVIMVTHNPDLADKYATRVIRMSDGDLVSDTNPYEGETLKEKNDFLAKKKAVLLTDPNARKKKTSMSFFTALGLSFNNMMTKKARTILVSFAGSIGIIGIALIMSVSFGFDNYISSVETDAMSSYPMTIYQSAPDFSLASLLGTTNNHEFNQYPTGDEIVENSTASNMVTSLAKTTQNDTASLKLFLENPATQEKYGHLWNAVQYSYSQSLRVYKKTNIDGNQNDKITALTNLSDQYSYLKQSNTYRVKNTSDDSQLVQDTYRNYIFSSVESGVRSYFVNAFSELIDNEDLLKSQYDVLAGRMPEAYNEVILGVDSYNEVSDYLLFGMGVKDPSYLMSQLAYYIAQDTPYNGMLPEPAEGPKFRSTFSDLLNVNFSTEIKAQSYKKVTDSSTLGYHYESRYSSPEMKGIIDNSLELKVVGIVRDKPGVTATSMSGCIGYSPELYSYLVNQGINPTDQYFSDATVLKDQLANPDYDMYTGELFQESTKAADFIDRKNDFGYVDETTPSAIRIYPTDFSSKEGITNMIKDYNASVSSDKKVTITDTMGTVFASLQVVVDSVSYVLIAFVSISLIVSSIMIGIITYVSVLERTKEIGVLRSVGARKKDISRVFNAETLITGLAAGVIGVGFAAILDIPIMLIINALAHLNLTIAVPWYGAILLPLISISLTLIAGIIPSSIAANKDPVVALRTE